MLRRRSGSVRPASPGRRAGPGAGHNARMDRHEPDFIVVGDKVAGLAAYERARFRRIGVRRGARISRGRPTDVVLMDAVPRDFGASVLR